MAFAISLLSKIGQVPYASYALSGRFQLMMPGPNLHARCQILLFPEIGFHFFFTLPLHPPL